MSAAPSAELRHKLAAARLWAAQRFPYLATVLFASPVVYGQGGTVSADRHWRLYVDADRAANWPVEVLGSMLVVQANHLLREHAERADTLGLAGDEDRAAWSDAADAEINDDLADVLRLPEGDKLVLPDDFDAPRGHLAEEYFDVVRRSGQRSENPDRGSGTHGQAQPGEQPAPPDGEPPGGSTPPQGEGEGDDDVPPGTDRTVPDGVSASDADLIRRQAAADIAAEQRRAGNVPAGLVRWANARLHPKVDWRRALAAEIRRCIADVRGQVDYSYRRPSRRAGSTPGVVLPALRRPQPEVAVVCDTSASMGDDRLAQVLAEVEGLLRSVGVGGLTVLSVDVEVHRARRVQHAGQVELVGGGGTDMGAGITAALTRRPRPDVIVVLTDGETPWPPRCPPGVRVVVGLLGTRAPAAPGWARSVRIDEVA